MNFASIQSRPTVQINRPIKVSPKGNLYKVNIAHADENGENVKKFEVWTTKEAVQQHFPGMTGNPAGYQIQKFARQVYEKQLRNSYGRQMHKGILVTTDQVTHGDPKLWPNTLAHPEIKY